MLVNKHKKYNKVCTEPMYSTLSRRSKFHLVPKNYIKIITLQQHTFDITKAKSLGTIKFVKMGGQKQLHNIFSHINVIQIS